MVDSVGSDPGVPCEEPKRVGPGCLALHSHRTLRKFRQKFKNSFLEDTSLTELEEIGVGGFAIVRKCRLKSKNGEEEVVAVKELRDSCFSSERDVDDFFSETQLLRLLDNPNVVQFKGVTSEVGNKGPSLAIIQEYMNLGSLKDLLVKQMRDDEKGLYSWESGLTWMLQVARGLAHLHGLKATVIHRDLKPENILLTSTNGGLVRAKIADFGLSAMVRKPKRSYSGIGRASLNLTENPRKFNKSASLRKQPSSLPASEGGKRKQLVKGDKFAGSNMIRCSTFVEKLFERSSVGSWSWDEADPEIGRVSSIQEEAGPLPVEEKLHDLSGRTGSLMYMAPEVLRSEKYNEKVDTFSFGVILFEVLSGYKIIYMILDMNSDPMLQIERYAENVAKGFRPPIPADWPASIRTLISDCWAADPMHRPRMKDVVKRLEHILMNRDFTMNVLLKALCCCPVQ
ncbi:hypothetical protein BSKO_07255 [Bryopsis sp. KO-2023]|nr:hypothetical protein BSKO_07255 [Bryopsis sp. KO-2023]